MKNSIKIIFCVFVLLNSSSYAENTDKFEERDFFCCSIYDLYKTSSTINNNKTIKKNIFPAKNKIEDIKIIKTNTNEINVIDNKVKPFNEENNILKDQQRTENNIFSKKSQDHIEVEADESYWHEKKQLTILQGDTKITRGNETIKSELTNYLQNENRARLSGNVQYNADGIEVNAPYAEYDTKEARTDFISPKYKYSSLNITGKARYGVRLKNKKQCIKNAIMDSHVVVGVGNIYASEALYHAGIRPHRISKKISMKEIVTLVQSIKNVIKEAIIKGGSTMNDFFDVNGENGYFQNDHKVYDREDEPCFKCQFPIKQLKLGQRSSFFCKKCQK